MQESSQTHLYYDQHAQAFIDSTLDVDMQSIYARFTSHLEPGASILDAGCGSGRDSLYFRQQGYQVVAIDACEAFVRHTRAYAGVEAHCQQFEAIDFEAIFDGIWASASLLHLTSEELPKVVQKLGKALRTGGILYASFKYGNFAGLRNGRWFTDLDEQGLESLLKEVPVLRLLETWQSGDARPERAHERWLNCLLKLR